MSMPNFFIIGAIRSGTTSTYNYLGQHPEIYVSPVKEPNFFSFEDFDSVGNSETRDNGEARPANESHNAVTDMAAYQALFSGVRGEKAVGEASVHYLTDPGAPVRIHAAVPHARLIAILRNPVDRAFSSFLFHIRRNRETVHDFMQALQADDGWRWEHYIEDGMYFKALTRYYSVFGMDQVLVCLYDDLAANPLNLIQGIFGFLGVDHAFTPDVSIRYNVSGIPKRRWLHRIIWEIPEPLKRLVRPLIKKSTEKALRGLSGRNLHRPQLDMEGRRYLLQIYKEDISNLQDLIGRDLSHWLESETQEEA